MGGLPGGMILHVITNYGAAIGSSRGRSAVAR